MTGTGSYTVLSQIAAELIGQPIQRVSKDLGDSNFATTPESGILWNAARSGLGLFSACIYLQATLAENMGIKLHHVIFAKVSFNTEKRKKSDQRSQDLAGWVSAA